MTERAVFEPIVAEPSVAWRDAVFGRAGRGRAELARVMAEDTWVRCETAASRMLNSVPGGDNYSKINPRSLMREAGGISPSTFYGHRSNKSKRLGIVSVGRGVSSIAVRALAEDILPLNSSIESGEATDAPAFYLPAYLAEILRFAQTHPEEARGFSRAMCAEVMGQGFSARNANLPIHPVLVVTDPVAKLLCASGASKFQADTEHVVRMVMDTGADAGLKGRDVNLSDVGGIEHLMGRL